MTVYCVADYILICMKGTLSCGDSIAYPDCSFCPIDNETDGKNGCNGNCQMSSYTNLCEKRGIESVNMAFEFDSNFQF